MVINTSPTRGCKKEATHYYNVQSILFSEKQIEVCTKVYEQIAELIIKYLLLQ